MGQPDNGFHLKIKAPSSATNTGYSLQVVTILPTYFRPTGTHQWFAEVYTEISLTLSYDIR
jgi:hypothetical protein